MSSYKAGLADPLPTAIWLDDGHGGRVAFAAYPAPQPWLHLLISHGYGEHMGWYDHVARTLQAQGVSAYLFDHYHHGRSSGRPADVPDYAELVDGLRLVLQQGVQPQRQPGVPLALLGHSNGGLVSVLAVAALPQGTFDALVLCAPFLGFPPGLQRTMLPLVHLLGLLIPRFVLPVNGLPQLRTADRSIWPDYERDPLRFRGLSVRFVRAMLRALAQAWRAPTCQGLPLLLAFGEQDRVVDLPSALRWFERVESPDKELRPYPGLRHELFQEAAWRDVLQDVSGWLRARLG